MTDTELQDRLDIEKAMRHYAVGLDERRWEEWDLAFAADAAIDFTPMGGKRETPVRGMTSRWQMYAQPGGDALDARWPAAPSAPRVQRRHVDLVRSGGERHGTSA